MRISDWSSDVCSSDLILPSRLREGLGEGMFVGWVAVTGPPQTPPASGRGLTRLARLISCNAPRTAPFTTPQCGRSEEHTSELQSLMRISYAVFCLKKKKTSKTKKTNSRNTYTNIYEHY